MRSLWYVMVAIVTTHSQGREQREVNWLNLRSFFLFTKRERNQVNDLFTLVFTWEHELTFFMDVKHEKLTKCKTEIINKHVYTLTICCGFREVEPLGGMSMITLTSSQQPVRCFISHFSFGCFSDHHVIAFLMCELLLSRSGDVWNVKSALYLQQLFLKQFNCLRLNELILSWLSMKV